MDLAGLTQAERDGVERARAAGQEGVLRLWDRLDAAGRKRLAAQLGRVDFDLVGRLVRELVTSEGTAAEAGMIEPTEAIPWPRTDEARAEEARLAALGAEALAAGRVGVIVAAGGQGTRLGFDRPKGEFPVGPVSGATLFEMHARKVLALSRRHRARVPFFIMTSETNRDAIAEFLASRDFFGLEREDVLLFAQGMLPAVSLAGQMLLDAPDHFAESPDGHGGTVRALAASGALEVMAKRGIETVFYFQVDNPLVEVADATFLGRHLDARAEMSLKVLAKRDAAEKVGVIARRGGKLCVVEYSDLPDELAEARDEAGRLAYNWGSIAIHAFSRAFLERLAAGDGRLPFHRANKKVPCLDEAGALVEPAEPNAVKFESFIFDALPLAARTVASETLREEEFSPLKNKSGEDSVETCTRDLQEKWARWLAAAGVALPRTASGALDCAIEIDPCFALDAQDLARRVDASLRVASGEKVLLR